MSNVTSIQLKDTDLEDIEDVLKKIEKSFGFKFGRTELKEVKTFGVLCDIITDKVKGDSSSDCTTQQAFYKLRSAIGTVLSIEKSSLTVDTRLDVLFPRKQRRRKIKEAEGVLGFKT